VTIAGRWWLWVHGSYYEWAPLEDITAYELSQSMLLLVSNADAKEIFDNLTDGARRHWRPV